MPRYLAFLRAINVGGHTVKMDHLRALFEALGFGHVATFIASANVIFDSLAAEASAEAPEVLEAQIEQHLKAALGYQVTTFLRTTAELGAIAAHQPFAETAAEHTLMVAFLKNAPPETVQQALLDRQTASDTFHFHGRELYWLVRTRYSDSPFSGALLEKILGMPATVRNVTTVRKLAAKVADAQ